MKLSEDSCHITDIVNNSIKKDNQNIDYIAPEILKKEEYNEKCDLWSLGVIIYVLSFGQYPYIGDNKEDILNEIKKNRNITINTGDSNLDNLISELLKEDPNERFTWEQYLNHSFLKTNVK